MVAATLGVMSPLYASHVESRSQTFHIVIPTVLRFNVVSRQENVYVNEVDIERGYVDVDNAMSLRITSNDPRGYLLAAMAQRDVVREVALRTHGNVLDVLPAGSAVLVRSGRLEDVTVAFDLRLYLAAGLKPGRHAWPVSLHLQPEGGFTASTPFP